MKKVLLACCILLSSVNLFAEANNNFYSVVQVNTKKWGCEKMEERTNEAGVHILRCENPGEVICQFKDGTCPIVKQDGVKATIDANLTNGVFYGTVDLPEGGTVTWNAEDVNNISYDFSIPIK